MNIEQQREYVDTLEGMWRRNFAAWPKFGIGSKPETALIDVLAEARKKLQEMENKE